MGALASVTPNTTGVVTPPVNGMAGLTPSSVLANANPNAAGANNPATTDPTAMYAIQNMENGMVAPPMSSSPIATPAANMMSQSGGALPSSNLVPNSLANTASNPNAAGAIAPNLGVTAGSDPGAGSLTQGTALPNITTTQMQATATPQFYTNYLNQLAKQGATAAQTSQYASTTPMQQQAYDQAAGNVGNYQNTLNNATNLASSVGSTSLADAIGNYGQANIAANMAPGTTAGIVGAGQFGSTRGANALGQNLATANLGITQQQQAALQQDQANKIAAANSLGTLATTTQNLGLGDVNALATLGGQQQTNAQNQQNYPMSQLAAESNLLKGATIPTATSSSYTGPIPGAYNNSPLSQIAALGSSVLGTGLGQTLFGSPANGPTAATSGLVGKGLSSAYNYLTGQPTGTGLPAGVTVSGTDPTTGTPTYVDSSGTPVDQFGNPAFVSNNPSVSNQNIALDNLANTPDITNSQSYPTSPDFIGP